MGGGLPLDHGQIPLWIKISPARDLLLLFQSAKEDRTPLEENAPLEWREKWGERKGCPFAYLLPHRDTQGQFNIDLYHSERGRDKENITHRKGMDSCPLLLLWELPSSTRSRNSLWGRSPAQRGSLKLSRCILHLLTNICWHPIQLCWKQSSLQPQKLCEASPLPSRSELLWIRIVPEGQPLPRVDTNFGQNKDLHIFEWLVLVLPLTVPVLWHKEAQDFPLFLLHFASKAQSKKNIAQGFAPDANRSCTMYVCSLGLCYPSAVLLTLFVLPELIFSHFQEIMCIY